MARHFTNPSIPPDDLNSTATVTATGAAADDSVNTVAADTGVVDTVATNKVAAATYAAAEGAATGVTLADLEDDLLDEE